MKEVIMKTDLFGTPRATLDSIPTPMHRGRRAGTLGIVATAAIALLVGGMGATASSDPGRSTTAERCRRVSRSIPPPG
jgi:hypothetical protein